MPSYAQLQSEVWWDREVVTPELDWLGDELCRRGGRPRDAFGSKGNDGHLNGGHRSQEWIKNSRWCTNRSYTVQSGLTTDQARHIAAGDYTPGAWGGSANHTLVAQQTRRLWDAAKRGDLTGVTQVEGTLDGHVTAGLNVGSGATFRPDGSHLDHWHLTFDRRYLRDAGLMARIVDTALGTTGGLMFCAFGDKGPAVKALQLQIKQVRPDLLAQHGADGDYGQETADAVSIALTGGPGRTYGPDEFALLQQLVAAKFGGGGAAGEKGDPGPAGPQGPKGEPGAAAVIAAGAELRVVATRQAELGPLTGP